MHRDYFEISGDPEGSVLIFLDQIASIQEKGTGCLVQLTNGTVFNFTRISYGNVKEWFTKQDERLYARK